MKDLQKQMDTIKVTASQQFDKIHGKINTVGTKMGTNEPSQLIPSST